MTVENGVGAFSQKKISAPAACDEALLRTQPAIFSLDVAVKISDSTGNAALQRKLHFLHILELKTLEFSKLLKSWPTKGAYF